MKEYVIDGNNLIHKLKGLSSLQRKDKQLARESLALKIDRYFQNKKVKVYIYFDGYQNLPIKTAKIKVVYSEKYTADEKIIKHIERASNPRNIILISSDDEIKRLAQACAAEIMNSENFALLLSESKSQNEEEKRIDDLDNDEFKRLFGVDDNE
jgi:predicted RNA-binding protein with PIN domain